MTADSSSATEVDVLIVGAGISGIGAAHALRQQRPDTSFVVLESQSGFGGTWRTHRYPGIRSDSDLYTFGYRFKPWVGPPIAGGDEILRYLGEVIDEHDLDRWICYEHRIESASWSTDDARWSVEVLRTDTDERVRYRTKFLWMCQGYYRHNTGYTPEWPGMDDFEGEIIHPQTWPEDTDLEGKNVVVIGSGSTAATLIPNIVDDTESVTMLQRSPSYFRVQRNQDEIADLLNDLDIPVEWTHEILRRKNAREQGFFGLVAREEPEFARDELFAGLREILGDDYPLEPHFAPAYRPWQQRVAIVPDGDFLHAVKEGKATIVTDHIERFTPHGIALRSGDELPADVVITATGFSLSVLGEIDITIDDDPLDLHDRVTWRGAMFTGVPNLLWVFGYFRFSWTLRVDLLTDFVCRLLDHMDELGVQRVIPVLRPQDEDMTLSDWVDDDDFNPGYLQRGLDRMPKQGERDPWRHTQDYEADRAAFAAVDLDDGTLEYS